jgi:PTS system mannose-specific IIA component
LATEYKAAVEHVVGAQRGIAAVTIGADCDRAAKQIEICQAADGVDTGGGVVIVTDMFGGSPSNLSLSACNCANRRVLYGANLPLLVKLAKSRSQPCARSDFAGHRRGAKIYGLPSRDSIGRKRAANIGYY